jgi:hypothetical protein
VAVYYGEGWAAPVGMDVDVDAAEEGEEGPNADVVENIYYHLLEAASIGIVKFGIDDMPVGSFRFLGVVFITWV